MAESDVVGGMPPGGLDGGGGGAEPESLSPYEQQLMHLERQLDIESKVSAAAVEAGIYCFPLTSLCQGI